MSAPYRLRPSIREVDEPMRLVMARATGCPQEVQDEDEIDAWIREELAARPVFWHLLADLIHAETPAA